MRFVHIADIHFDTPFNSLDSKKGIGETRRLEQRNVFKKVIEYIKNNDIEFLFISGDLYDQNYVKSSTIEFINSMFREIPETKIIISPGNHDPLIKNSYYLQYQWEKNVYIFDSNVKKYEFNGINIYGYGFNNYYVKESGIQNIVIANKDKINILVVHATLGGGIENEYNPVSIGDLSKIGFDYIALGHIHKPDYSNKKMVYPGSTVSLGLDEPGEHGMILGEIDKDKLEVEFIKLDNRDFSNKEVDITNINSELELVEYINSIVQKDEKTVYMYKIMLVGERNFEIDEYNILKLISNDSVLKLKNMSKLKYDIDKIEKENNLKGFFIQEMKKLIRENPDKKEEIEKGIEIGLNSFN